MQKVVRIIIICCLMVILTNASAMAWQARIHVTEPNRYSASKSNANEIKKRQDVANGINLAAKILAVIGIILCIFNKDKKLILFILLDCIMFMEKNLNFECVISFIIQLIIIVYEVVKIIKNKNLERRNENV